jgi:hypothetical protein
LCLRILCCWILSISSLSLYSNQNRRSLRRYRNQVGLCELIRRCSVQLTGFIDLVHSLSTDVDNCGYKGNVCPKFYAYGGVGLCQSGLCTTQCTSGFSFNFNTGQCQDTSSDLENCGYCGSKCAVLGASTAVCSSGTCYATSCQPG